MPSCKSINTCKGCEQPYCFECCEASNWQEFCTDECEKEHLEEED